MKDITLGTDSEVFLADKETKEPVSAIGLIGGKKETPISLAEFPGFLFSEDNVTAEFATPPCNDEESFVSAVSKGLFAIKNHIINKKSLKLMIKPSAEFKAKDLNNEDAQRIGCDPDWCVYTREPNEKPSYDNLKLRAAGGHIHVGYPNPKISKTEKMVKNMDLFLGIPGVILDRDQGRRKLYGQAGSFRIKDYGFEYRTLSNFWIKSARLVKWAYNNTILAINYNGAIATPVRENIRNIINNSSLAEAKKIVATYKIPMPGDEEGND